MTEIHNTTIINGKRAENPQGKKTSQSTTSKNSGTDTPLFKASRPSAELEAKLKKLGLVNYNGYGNKISGHYSKTNRQEEFTVIGQGTNGRTIAQSKSGQIVVIAHDGVILKSDYVQNPQKYEDAKKYNENVKTIKSAGSLARQFYQIADDNSGLNSMQKMQNLLHTKINSKNIVAFLNEYDKDSTKREDSSIIDTVTSEVGAGGTKQQRQVLMTIMNKLAAAAKEAGVSDGDIKKAKADFETSLNKEFNASFRRTNPKDMENAMDFLRGAIAAKQTSNVRNMTDKEAIQAFNKSFSAENRQAQNTYNQAKGEGWSFSARMGDTICGWFGCNTIEEVEAKLGENAKYVILLMSAKTEEEFKQYYKKVTDGIEFDPQKIAAAEAAQTNLTMAQGLSRSIKTYNQILTKSNGQSLTEFENSVKGALKMSDEEFNALKNTVYSNCKTESDKKQALNQYLRAGQEKISTEYRNLTKGKTLEQMQKDVKLIRQSTFGTKIITKDSDQFTQNMTTTEMVSDIAGDIALTVALSAIPGGAAWGASRMAATAAKWGVKGAKLAKTLNKTAIGFNKVKKFEQGTKWAAQAKRGDTSAKVANVTAKTVSSAGNAAAGTAIYEASATNHSAEEIKEKCLTNGIYGAIGAGASELAPKLMSAFKINSNLANEVAEEIINATGSLGVETAKGGEYGTSDATVDIVSGILMARLSHVGSGGVKVKGGKPATQTAPPSTSAYIDDNGNILAGGLNSNGSGGFFSRVKDKISNAFSSETELDKQLRTAREAKKQKAVDNGLNEAIASGKVSSNILDRLNAPPSSHYISDSFIGNVVSDRLVDALARQKRGNTFVNKLANNVDPKNISKYVPDGDVCSINGQLYVNDNGNALPIKMSEKKFNELFDPMKLATMSQDGGTHICVATSQINSMLETPSGRARLFTMLEDNGNGITVNLANGNKPVFFPNGKPVKMPVKFMSNAPDGIQMIEQAFMANNIKKASVSQVTDISTLSATQLGQQSTEIMNRRSTTEAAMDIGGSSEVRYSTKNRTKQGGHTYKENIRESLVNLLNDFVPGQDVMICHWGGHAKSVISYDPQTQIVTYRDPMSGGVDTQCTFTQFMNKGYNDYGLQISLQKRNSSSASSRTNNAPTGYKDVGSTNINGKNYQVYENKSGVQYIVGDDGNLARLRDIHKSPVISQKTAQEPQASEKPVTQAPQPKKTTINDAPPVTFETPKETIHSSDTFVSKSTELSMGKTFVVARTAEGNAIGATITNSNVVIKKDGKYTNIPIPKNGENVPIFETSTDTFLIIKNDNGKISIVTSATEELPDLAHVKQNQSNSGQKTATTENISANNMSTKQSDNYKQPAKPPLEVPQGARLIDTVEIFGKQRRRIRTADGKILTEYNGKWRKL